MGVEAFLRFWSLYNTLIIEILIGLILLTVVYLAFRTFFGAEEEVASGVGSELKSADLEKTLQKILERQESSASAAPHAAPAGEASASSAAQAVSGSGSADVGELKAQLAERERQLEELKKTASEATASGGLQGDEKKDYENRLKDLEARLAEYEIISEDIADLSFYKEENGKLQTEIEALKSKVGEASAAPAAAAEPPPAAAPSPAPAEELAAPLVEATVEVAAATPASEPTVESLIQETPTQEPAPATEAATEIAASAEAAPLPKEEEAELMNQFENFVKKG